MKKASALIYSTSITAMLVAFGQTGFAQTAETDSAKKGDEIVVIGSRITNNTDANTSPVDVVTAARIEGSPRPTLGDYFFTDVTQNIGRESNLEEGQEQGQRNGDRSSGINLRGLGSENTLVLIDGQRTVEHAVVNGDGWRSVNINTAIPRIALNRVEILLDGGSALYGTDAVAGVVNIVPNYEFDGLKFTYDTNRFDSTLGSTNDTLGLMVGKNFEKISLMGALEYRMADLVTDYDTGLFDEAQVLADGPQSGPIFQNGTGRRSATLLDPLCEDASAFGGQLFAGAPVAGSCAFYDVEPFAQQNEQDAYNAMLSAKIDLADNFTVTLSGVKGVQEIESILGNNSTTQFNAVGSSLSPVPNSVSISQDNPAVQYYLDQFPTSNFATGLAPSRGVLPTIHSRTMPVMNYLGNVTEGYKSDTTRFNIKAEWDVSENWDVAAYFTHGVSDVEVRRRETIPARAQAAFDGLGGPNCTGTTPGANGCEWLNPFMSSAAGITHNGVSLTNSNELVNWVYPESTRDHRAELSTAQLILSGQVPQISLPGGNLGVALGLEKRDETLEADFDALLNSGGYASFQGVPTPDYKGDESVVAVFGELGVPLLENLNVQLAGRYEDYSSAGVDTFNYKAGVNWNPVDRLFLRGSYGTSFKAPTIYQGQLTSFTDPGWGSFGDPSDADYVGGFGPGTSRALLNEVVSPNTALLPQESNNLSFGGDWDITDKLKVSADFVSIDFENVIYIPRPTDVIRLSSCNTGLVGVSDPANADGVHPLFNPIDGFPCFTLDPTALPDGETFESHVPTLTSTAARRAFLDQYYESVFISPQNLATRNLQAVDLALFWEHDFGSVGFSIRPKATILLKWDEQLDPNGETLDYVGRATPFGGGYSKYRVNVPASFVVDNHKLTVTGRYISKMDPILEGGQTFGAFTQFDANYQWNINDQHRVNVFVNNIADKIPENLAPAQFPRDGRRIGLGYQFLWGG